MAKERNIREVIAGTPPEPLLPVEKKLIAFSLGTGLVLLVILVLVGRLIPAVL